MEDILYLKVDQNIPTQHKTLKYGDIATLYCTNKAVADKIKKADFYTLDDKSQKTVFSIEKVFEGIHKMYPNLHIENVGERDFIVDYEKKSQTGRSPIYTHIKTALVCLIAFFGAAFTIMTFDEDVNVAKVFEHICRFVTGRENGGSTILEVSYATGLPIGMLVFYNHFKRKKIKDDPTPIQVEMCNYEEQVNKAMIKTASREGDVIDIH